MSQAFFSSHCLCLQAFPLCFLRTPSILTLTLLAVLFCSVVCCPDCWQQREARWSWCCLCGQHLGSSFCCCLLSLEAHSSPPCVELEECRKGIWKQQITLADSRPSDREIVNYWGLQLSSLLIAVFVLLLF